MNKNRLTTNLDSLNKLNKFEMEEIDFRLNTLLEKQKKGVWVYDRDLLVEGSPFPNITQACKSLGIGPRSSYLNSGKLVNNRYLFLSNPMKSN